MFKEQLLKYKDDFDKCKNDLKNIKTWYKQIPNFLTLSRLLGAIPINVLFFAGNVMPAIILTLLLLSTDMFDGKLARKWNVESKLGADMDAICDKVMFLGLALPLVMVNPLIIFNIFSEGVISFINLYGRLSGFDTRTLYSGKVKTCFLSVLLFMGHATHFFDIPMIVLNIMMLITSVSQKIAILDYMKVYKEMRKEKDMNILGEPVVNFDDVNELSNSKNREEIINNLMKEKEFLLSIKDNETRIKPKKRTLSRKRYENKHL